jgi:hypothetical protein
VQLWRTGPCSPLSLSPFPRGSCIDNGCFCCNPISNGYYSRLFYPRVVGLSRLSNLLARCGPITPTSLIPRDPVPMSHLNAILMRCPFEVSGTSYALIGLSFRAYRLIRPQLNFLTNSKDAHCKAILSCQRIRAATPQTQPLFIEP